MVAYTYTDQVDCLHMYSYNYSDSYTNLYNIFSIYRQSMGALDVTVTSLHECGFLYNYANVSR